MWTGRICGGEAPESGTVGYPCWSGFPYPYSHSNANDKAADHNKLLRHGDPDGKHWVPAMADTPCAATTAATNGSGNRETMTRLSIPWPI